jgi:integrase
MALEAVLGSLVRLVWQLAVWLRHLRSEAESWRGGPPGYGRLWRSTLKGNGAAYDRVLQRFDAHCRRRGLDLTTAADVDAAASAYCPDLGKGEAATLVAALLKAYPPLRGKLPWLVAVQRCQAALTPTAHHAPLSWRFCVGVASNLCLLGRRADAVVLLLQWRLGLRPSEAMALRASHIWLPGDTELCGVVEVGARRGTKVRRRQYVRIHPQDDLTWWLLRRLLACRPGDAPVGKWSTTAQMTYWIRKASGPLGVPCDRWSAHSARAGWASARQLSGQPIDDLLIDGRWASVSTLRVYLDVLGAMTTELETSSPALDTWLDAQEASLRNRFYWF